MKSRLFVPLLLLVAAPWSAAGHAPAAAAPPAQDSDFRQRYEQAMKINAIEEMGRLIRRNDADAVLWVIQTCEAISETSSDKLEETIAALRVGWEAGMGTDFVDKMYVYLSLLSPPLKRERHAARGRYEQMRKRYQDNLKEKDGPTFEMIAIEARGLARVFEELGDHYFASQSWIHYGLCHSTDLRGPNADLYEATRGYKAALTAREAIELKDRHYNEVLNSYTHLAAQGYGARPGEERPGGEGGGAGAAGGVATELATAAVASMSFHLVPKVDAFERPNYHADEFYQIWDGLHLEARGSSGKFHKLEELSPSAVRRGDSQVVIEAQGNGKGEVEVPMTGNLEPVRFEIGAGEERRPWAVLTTLGIQNDQYQSLQMNLAPTTDNLTIYSINAGSMVGQVAGTRVQILDDNMDGIYGSPPRTWQNVGMSEGRFQPELDCIVVGNEQRARPWSEYQQIGDTWYRLEVQKAGNELVYTPVEVQTGFLSLEYSGPRPSWVVMQGGGRWENSYFDIAGARGKGAEVPVGRYALYYGEVRKGKRRQMMKTLIVPTDRMQRWEVAPGEVTKVKLGAPYGFDFSFKVTDGELVVPGRSVVVVGTAGERYERAWNCVPTPDVLWREKGSRRASRPEGMDALMDTDPVYAEGYHVAWFPRDLRLQLPPNRSAIEVQLTDRRHRLFGKIESAWKE